MRVRRWDEFLQTVYPQMRLSTEFELCLQLINGALLAGAGGIGIWLWMNEIGWHWCGCGCYRHGSSS